MIFWSNNKGGFAGGLKYKVKGLFQSFRSVTSATIVDTEDCFTPLQGLIDDTPTIGLGLIDIQNNHQGLIELQNNFQGLIEVQNNFEGLIGETTLALNGIIDADPIALQGALCC